MTGQELIARYRENYGIPNDAALTEEMILRHWGLERSLRTELLAAAPDDRWEVFARCYDRLYSELAWLNADVDQPSANYANWVDIIGPPPLRIYEVGSGKGGLIHFLATRGYACKGSEITRERGEALVPAHPNLSWGVTDGVHLDRFEPLGFYDVVVSDQVVEHLHPDDLVDHFKGAFAILSARGRYIVSTPHAHAGPSDVSRVFRRDTTMGMHLREYTHGEIAAACRTAGFRHARAVLRVPARLRQRLRGRLEPRASAPYTGYVCRLEGAVALVPHRRLRRAVASSAKPFLLPSNIMMVAEKS